MNIETAIAEVDASIPSCLQDAWKMILSERQQMQQALESGMRNYNLLLAQVKGCQELLQSCQIHALMDK